MGHVNRLNFDALPNSGDPDYRFFKDHESRSKAKELSSLSHLQV